jgi:uncharacterized protein
MGPGTWKIQSVALDLSGRCNLACRYCAESATQPTRPALSAAMLQQTWDWYQRERPASSCSVHIGSGEPLLALPRLKQVASLVARNRGDGSEPISVFLTTNGTLVDQNTADWLAASKWDLKISFDGAKGVHDKWRVTTGGEGTYDRVAQAIANLAPKLGENLHVVSVLCRGTDPFDLFATVSELGARRMEIIPVVHADPEVLPNRSDLERYERFMFEYAGQFLGGEADPAVILNRFELFVMRVMGYRNQWLTCGAGRSYVGVGHDGALYPCMRFVGIDRYQIGQLPDGVDPNAAQDFQRGPGRRYDERYRCRSCWAAPLCSGPCFACAEMFDIDHHCAMYRAEAAAAVRLVQELRKRDPTRLLSFLGI